MSVLRLGTTQQAIAASGANLKSYGAARTSPFNYNDTIGNFNQFFNINDATSFYQGEGVSSSWLGAFRHL